MEINITINEDQLDEIIVQYLKQCLKKYSDFMTKKEYKALRRTHDHFCLPKDRIGK